MTTKTNEEYVSEIADTVYTPFDTTMPGAIHTYGQIPGLNATIRKILTQKDKETALAVEKERERHAKEVNRILNLHSKPIAEGGLDYVKAFEEMERYEHRLFKSLHSGT